jgi:plastocyanin
MATQVVVIVSDEEGISVVPSALLANEGDTVKFRNLTKNSVTLAFTNADVFGCTDKTVSKDQKEELTVGSVGLGSYFYDAITNIGGEMVYAHASRPKIIIHDVFN